MISFLEKLRTQEDLTDYINMILDASSAWFCRCGHFFKSYIIYTAMDYCPNCQHILDEDESVCSTCGFKIMQETDDTIPLIKNELVEEAEHILPNKKPFYKRPAFWITMSVLIVIISAACGAAGAYFYYQNKATKAYKTKVKSIWTDVVSKSKSLNNTVEAVNNQKDMRMLSNELKDMENSIADKQSEAVNLEPPKKYAQQNKDFLKVLDDLANYVIQAKIMANKDLVSVQTKKLSNLKEVSDIAKTSTSNFVMETDFISTNMPEGVFRMNMVYKPLILEAKAQDEIKKEAQRRKKAAADKKSARQTVISFMQARIHKDVTEMRRYLTEACVRDFNPDTEFQGEYNSTDFRVIKIEATAEGFTVTGDERSRSWQGSTITNRWQFKLIFDSNDWLIDHRNILPPDSRQTVQQ